jgi:hypothetical protein
MIYGLDNAANLAKPYHLQTKIVTIPLSIMTIFKKNIISFVCNLIY